MYAIFGSPGCGKTTRLMSIVQDRLAQGKSVTVCSYTRAAAEEITKRCRGVGRPGMLKVGTIHSLCFGAARLSRQQVLQPSDLQKIGRMAGVEVQGKTADTTSELALGDEYSGILMRAGATGEDPFAVYLKSDRPGTAAQFKHFLSCYRSFKEEYGFIDFNDVLWRGVEHISEVASDVLIVDEAQDLSPLQWRVVKAFVADEKIVAGDDDQSLYEWAGADPQAMLNIAEYEVLEKSYRIPAVVHKVALAIARKIATRREKEYLPRPEVGEYRQMAFHDVVGTLRHGEDTLVLYRTHRAAEDFEDALIMRGLPYSGANSPLDSKWAKAARVWEKVVMAAKSAGGQFIIDERAEAALAKVVTPKTMGKLLSQDRGMLERRWFEIMTPPGPVLRYMVVVEKKHGSLWVDPTIRLSTIHGAKGKEADRVVLFNSMFSRKVLDGFNQNMDSEARVWYVGATRAKRRLDMVVGPHPFIF